MNETTEYNLVGDELLIAVFNNFPKRENLNFEDESYIMRAFYNASKNPKYSSLFRNYHFDEDGIMPYSMEIEEGIRILLISSLLGKMNPSFSNYQLTNGIDHSFDTFIAPKLNKTQVKLIKELSEEIKKELSEEIKTDLI